MPTRTNNTLYAQMPIQSVNSFISVTIKRNDDDDMMILQQLTNNDSNDNGDNGLQDVNQLKCDVISAQKLLIFEHCDFIKQVLPKVIWEEHVTTPTSDNAFSHCVIAVACTMRNEALRKHYGTLQERYETLRKCCTSLRDIT